MKIPVMNMFRIAAAIVAFALPAQAGVEIDEVTSPGGIKAWLVQDDNIPFAALEIRFRGGTSLDPEGKRGAANLMAGLLEEGTGDLDSQGFSRARDALAADFSFNADEDAVSVSARFLTENRDEAVDLLRRALVEPRFDAESIERVRGQVLSGIRTANRDPDTLALRMMNALAFGDHPYATSGDGTEESVSALTRDDILAAYKAGLARDRVYVAAAGNISAQDLGQLLDRLLGGLPETGAPLPGRAPMELSGGNTVIDFPGPQSTVFFAAPGIRYDDPDFLAANILNEVIGGGRFSARLMTEIREKRGLTYGIGSYLMSSDHSELMIGRFSSANGTVAEAIGLVRKEWSKVAEEGISEAELAATKTYMTGQYALLFDSNAAIARLMAGMQMAGLPADYPLTRNDRVNAVTMEDVRRVAARLFRTEDLRFVVAGQPGGLTQSD